MTKDEVALVIICVLAVLCLGTVFGYAIGFDSAKDGHDYTMIRIVSQTPHVQVRAVLSPCVVDDQTIETIIDGKLVSRTKPVNFDFYLGSTK